MSAAPMGPLGRAEAHLNTAIEEVGRILTGGARNNAATIKLQLEDALEEIIEARAVARGDLLARVGVLESAVAQLQGFQARRFERELAANLPSPGGEFATFDAPPAYDVPRTNEGRTDRQRIGALERVVSQLGPPHLEKEQDAEGTLRFADGPEAGEVICERAPSAPAERMFIYLSTHTKHGPVTVTTDASGIGLLNATCEACAYSPELEGGGVTEPTSPSAPAEPMEAHRWHLEQKEPGAQSHRYVCACGSTGGWWTSLGAEAEGLRHECDALRAALSVSTSAPKETE